jgi:hypothetical protein
MSKYLDAQVQVMKNLRAQADSEPNPLRQAMLRNYYRHVALEISGRWNEFVEDYDTMMVENPLYHVKLGGPEVRTFTGTGGVKDFYSEIDSGIWVMCEEHTAVSDWGVLAVFYNTQLLKGSDMIAAGFEADDPAAWYAMEDIKISQFWAYDDRARLKGEDVYQLEPPKRIVKCAPEDIIGKKDIENALTEFFDLVPVNI